MEKEHLYGEQREAEEDRLEMNRGMTCICESCSKEIPSLEITEMLFLCRKEKVCYECKAFFRTLQEKSMRMAEIPSKIKFDFELCYNTMFKEKNEERAFALKTLFKDKWKFWAVEWY